MRYLLIDNCTLRDLIDKQGYSKYLSELEALITENKIEFVTHELVIQEWEKHKNKWQKQKEQKLLGNDNSQSVVLNDLKTNIPFLNLISIDHIEIQIQQIDKFLANSKIILETPTIILNEFSERFRKKLAPFHKKTNSQNDWEIIGTFCNYCEINGIKELYFMSSNHTDFGDEKSDFKNIHPDLKDRFRNVKIHYYKNYYDFFNESRNIDSISIEFIPYNLIPNKKYSYKTTIRKTVLESLFYLYDDLYSEINFIPTHLITKYYPFSSSEKSHTYFDYFTIHEVSENLVSFYKNINISDRKLIEIKNEEALKGIENYKEKTEFVIRKLNSNLIFHIVGEKSRTRVCSHYYNPIPCDCSSCSFNRFEFHKTLKTLKSESEDFKEKLKQAYFHTKLGNFFSAYKIYEGIIAKALDSKKFITYFIAKYNQRNLSDFLKNPFRNINVADSIIQKLSTIDKLEEAVKLKTRSDYDLLSFIAQEDFFSIAFQKIREATNDIVAHYHSQLRGGYRSNNHIWELIDSFVRLEAFLSSNYIIYDSYSNFTKLFENVIEGLFASHAISENQGTRFTSFDNYWISKFILYGERESIIALFGRYNLIDLKFESTNSDQNSLFELFNNLLISKRHLKKNNEYIDETNNFLDGEYSNYFDNILTMASLLDIAQGKLSDFSNILLTYIIENPKLAHKSNAAIRYFLSRKGKLLSNQFKYRFLNWSINKTDCFNNHLLHILETFKSDSLIKLSQKKFCSLINQTTEICQKCDQRHGFEILPKLFSKSPIERKKIITEKLKIILNLKFDFELFYIASIHEMIELDHNQLKLVISEYRIPKEKKKIRPFSMGMHDFQNSKLDQLINLFFKFKIDTNTPLFDEIKKTHKYYQWLLNMEKFDYSKFNSDWVLIYDTSFYLLEMSKSIKLKQFLRDLLKDKFDPRFERLLLRITNFITEG